MGDWVIETSDSPPPPSYEISQHEFDNKTKRILEETAAEPPRPRVDDDGFEIWDDAVFEAYALQDGIRSLSIKGSISSGCARTKPNSLQGSASNDISRTNETGSTSRFTQAQVDAGTPRASGTEPNAAGPISSQTRALDATRRRSEKQRFSLRSTASRWTNPANTPSSEPQASGSSSSSATETRRPPRAPRRQLTVFNDVGDVAGEGRDMTPPPEFTPVGPSLDGPPYEVVVMTYEGPELESADPDSDPPGFESPPESPSRLATGGSPHSSPVPPGPTSPDSPLYSPRTQDDRRQHLQPEATQRIEPTVTERHLRTAPSNAKFSQRPRIPFDPQTAYSRPLPSAPQRSDLPPQAVDAAAFYSHAVAAHFTANVPARLRQPVRSDRSSVSSVYSDQWSMPMPTPNRYVDPPTQVASPKPSYAYGRAAFSDTSSVSSESMSTSSQHVWSPGANGRRR
ncbi:hypothetical protein FKP32DRAFT_736529 [Trametes sanguinea]|nr:hypothetical protein FKP32DRAFT_736529 [Trametes sanguinea]